MMASEEKTGEMLKAIHDAVVSYDEEACEQLCKRALEEGVDPYEAVVKGLTGGMNTVGDLYTRQEYFVPELLLCSDALKAGLRILKPYLKVDPAADKGSLIIGVVEGDIHDIGKNLVGIMFEAAGWEIHDLGKDVKLERFAEEQQRLGCDVVAMSALMTTSMMGMPKAIEALKARSPKVRVIVGGAPLSEEIARRYGADGYASDAVTAVKVATGLLAAVK
jgi:dimethylamine corrinoid protein